jgi:hypothetical protein
MNVLAAKGAVQINVDCDQRLKMKEGSIDVGCEILVEGGVGY